MTRKKKLQVNDDRPYSERLEELAKMIAPQVTFSDIDDAEALMASRLLPMNHEASKRIPDMAVQFIEHATELELESVLNRFGSCFGTRLSALREAIVLCAKRYITEAKQALSTPAPNADPLLVDA